jgi:hypothetical protein
VSVVIPAHNVDDTYTPIYRVESSNQRDKGFSKEYKIPHERLLDHFSSWAENQFGKHMVIGGCWGPILIVMKMKLGLKIPPLTQMMTRKMNQNHPRRHIG